MFSEINIDELNIREKLALAGLAGIVGFGQRLTERLLGKRLLDGMKEELRQDGRENLWLAGMAVKGVVGGVRRRIL